jgi:hypothetical protein
MLVKKLGMLFVLVLFLVTLAAPSARVGVNAQTCSGDDCGCGIIFNECRLQCNGNLTCISECRRSWISCSRVCCGAPPRP